MDLATLDVLWNVPLLFVVFGGLWVMIRTGHDSKKMWKWHLASWLVWVVNAGIEQAQGDTVWMYVSGGLCALSLINAIIHFNRAYPRKSE